MVQIIALKLPIAGVLNNPSPAGSYLLHESARQIPRLRFNSVETIFNPITGLGGDPCCLVRILQQLILPPLVLLLMPLVKILSTPTRAARVITKVLINDSGTSGIYYDERGLPMQGSARVRDLKFQDGVFDEIRALLSTVR